MASRTGEWYLDGPDHEYDIPVEASLRKTFQNVIAYEVGEEFDTANLRAPGRHETYEEVYERDRMALHIKYRDNVEWPIMEAKAQMRQGFDQFMRKYEARYHHYRNKLIQNHYDPLLNLHNERIRTNRENAYNGPFQGAKYDLEVLTARRDAWEAHLNLAERVAGNLSEANELRIQKYRANQFQEYRIKEQATRKIQKYSDAWDTSRTRHTLLKSEFMGSLHSTDASLLDDYVNDAWATAAE